MSTSDPRLPPKARPRRYPPPEFPPRRPKLFARTPPMVFPAVLGLFGLGLALRQGLAALGLEDGLADLLLGAVVALWAFAVLAMAVKIARRPAVLMEDLRVLPGRVGLSCAPLGAMAAAEVLVPVLPQVAALLLWAGLLAHGALLALWLRLLFRLPAEARAVDPGWHLLLAGAVAAALPALDLGWAGLAAILFRVALTAAGVVWAISAVTLLRRIPPAPLRPLLVLHLLPASLPAATAAALGMGIFAALLLLLGAMILLALLACARWIIASGPTPLWGITAWPLTAFASALIGSGGRSGDFGLLLLIPLIGLVPWLAWRLLSQWPGGKLASLTNAAEA